MNCQCLIPGPRPITVPLMRCRWGQPHLTNRCNPNPIVSFFLLPKTSMTSQEGNPTPQNVPEDVPTMGPLVVRTRNSSRNPSKVFSLTYCFLDQDGWIAKPTLSSVWNCQYPFHSSHCRWASIAYSKTCPSVKNLME